METKGWLQSKTMWFNVLSLVAGGSGYVAGAMSAHPTLVCILVIVQAVGNLVLRKFTNTSIAKA